MLNDMTRFEPGSDVRCDGVVTQPRCDINIWSSHKTFCHKWRPLGLNLECFHCIQKLAIKFGHNYKSIIYKSVTNKSTIYKSTIYKSITYKSVTYKSVTYKSVTYKSVIYKSVIYTFVKFYGRAPIWSPSSSTTSVKIYWTWPLVLSVEAFGVTKRGTPLTEVIKRAPYVKI